MYALLALAFSSVEIIKVKDWRLKIYNIFISIAMLVFVVLLDSRAGIICLCVELLILLVWLGFIKKKLLMSVIFTVLIAGVIAVRLKVFDVVCFAFLVTIAINAMFESVFEMQMGIIFFCFFWQVFFQKNMGEQDTLSPQVIQDIKF